MKRNEAPEGERRHCPPVRHAGTVRTIDIGPDAPSRFCRECGEYLGRQDVCGACSGKVTVLSVTPAPCRFEHRPEDRYGTHGVRIRENELGNCTVECGWCGAEAPHGRNPLEAMMRWGTTGGRKDPSRRETASREKALLDRIVELENVCRDCLHQIGTDYDLENVTGAEHYRELAKLLHSVLERRPE